MQAILPLTLLALGWGVSATNPPASVEALRFERVAGPPAICLPLEVSGRTLPWGDDVLSPSPSYALAKLPADLVSILESEDTLTRMENLRRAAIALGPLHRKADPKQQAAIRIALLSTLRDRAVQALLDTKNPTRAGHCVFDLGYLQAALTQVDGRIAPAQAQADFRDGSQELSHAGKALPKDGAVVLGLALGLFDSRNGGADLAHFRRCGELARQDAMLAKNLKTAAHHFLSQEDYDELVRFLAD